jgi:hypothetical protein
MATTAERLERFFADYEARTNRALADPGDVDLDATAAAFAECFVAAGPGGVTSGRNGEALRNAIPVGLDLYRRIGTKAMHVRSLETTEIDALHAMCRVGWEARYERKDGRRLTTEFDVVYLLQLRDAGPVIFAWVAGDEQARYRELGLTPE